ncbi:MAG: tetratricopeptide repeat protein [Clostridia bacterium]|nr:tetratricopeptide repeat protein [Clostridia bacterium]
MELDAKNIVEAKNLVNEKEYSRAYELIKDVNIDLLSEESKAVYDSILPLTVKEFSKSKYNEGKTLFEQEDYESALNALNESIKLNDDESFTPEVMYYIARIYEKQNDTKKAKEMYARIINEYPNTHTAEQAKYYSGLLN